MKGLLIIKGSFFYLFCARENLQTDDVKFLLVMISYAVYKNDLKWQITYERKK